MLTNLLNSADLPDWCDRAGDELQSLFVRGKLSYPQYRFLGDVALTIALRCESGAYPWGIYDATDTLESAVAGVLMQTYQAGGAL